jgi:hypothetical protein
VIPTARTRGSWRRACGGARSRWPPSWPPRASTRRSWAGPTAWARWRPASGRPRRRARRSHAGHHAHGAVGFVMKGGVVYRDELARR